MSYRREYDPKRDLYRCTLCGRWKGESSFYKNPQYRWGLMSRCKDCHNAYHKERYASRLAHHATMVEQAKADFEFTGPPQEDLDLSTLEADPT